MPELIKIATQVRRDIVRMVHGANSGHPGGSLGCADFLTALYFKIMKHNPAFNMDAMSCVNTRIPIILLFLSCVRICEKIDWMILALTLPKFLSVVENQFRNI